MLALAFYRPGLFTGVDSGRAASNVALLSHFLRHQPVLKTSVKLSKHTGTNLSSWAFWIMNDSAARPIKDDSGGARSRCQRNLKIDSKNTMSSFLPPPFTRLCCRVSCVALLSRGDLQIGWNGWGHSASSSQRWQGWEVSGRRWWNMSQDLCDRGESRGQRSRRDLKTS